MSASQPQVAPQASEAPAVSANTQATATQAPTIPSQSSSGSTAANANANVNPTPNQGPAITAGTPTPGPNATSTPAPQVSTTEEPLSLNDKLNAADRYWKFKFGLTIIIIITGFIGIGCFGWLMNTGPTVDGLSSYGSYWYLWPSLMTWSISIIWSILCVTIFLVRKRTVHPGMRVSIELLLWLAFAATVFFAFYALQSVLDYGLYGGPDEWEYNYSSSSSGGDYVLASNNTWVWEVDNSYVTTPRNCTGSLSLFSDMHFTSCAEQDAYVNKIWAEKPHRASVTLTGLVCQFIGLILHFALFVWACIDTHRHNRSKVSKDAEKIAAGIVQNMIGNGAIVPPPRQAYMHPAMGQPMYNQPLPQGYSMQPMYMPQSPGQHMGQQQYMVPVQYPTAQQAVTGPAVGVAGPSNEKAARYA